jgi:two-component system chemotaxis response regulator CheY
MAAQDDDLSLRPAHALAAVVRTLLTEAGREGPPGVRGSALREQAVEESARLVSVLEDLSMARARHPHSVPPAKVPSDPDVVRRRPSILIVEDDDGTRSALALGLATSYEVTTARDGVEGLRATSGRTFDAIVTDVRMPEMDGITMVEKIRQAKKSAFVPVLFLTAETTPDRVAAGFSAGATSFMVKPLDLELLEAELRWLLGTTSRD